MNARTLDPAHHLIEKEPYYVAVGDEIDLFEAAYRQQIPVLLKGPTGCGKTRFMEHMAWRLKRPLITVSCHDDLTASDLVGRYLVKGGRNRVGRRPAHPRGARRRHLLPG
jgi:nitric oxide reductase NorQ protein